MTIRDPPAGGNGIPKHHLEGMVLPEAKRQVTQADGAPRQGLARAVKVNHLCIQGTQKRGDRHRAPCLRRAVNLQGPMISE